MLKLLTEQIEKQQVRTKCQVFDPLSGTMSLVFQAGKFSKGGSKSPAVKPILPLVPEKADEDAKVHKDKFIVMELKTKPGSAAASTSTHKKSVKLFEEGTPQDWIDVLDAIHEIWEQNNITSASNRSAIIRTILKGESKACYDVAVEDNIALAMNDDDAPNNRSVNEDDIAVGLDAVAQTVFPHRALLIQKQWMQRHMKKPWDLPVRRTMAAITRIDNALPKFPGGTPESKFSEKELIDLLEIALPQSWRAALDFKSFIPSEHTKREFIEECETIERNEVVEDSKKRKRDDNANPKSKANDNGKGETGGKASKHKWRKGKNAKTDKF